MVATLTVPSQLIKVGSGVVRHTGFTVPDELRAELAVYEPRSMLGRIAKRCFAYLPPDLAGELLQHISQSLVIESSLAAARIVGCPRHGPDLGGCLLVGCRRTVEDYGVVSRKVITTAGVNFLVDAFQNIVEPEILKYHGIGTGTNAEAIGDTALQTELTTQYNPDSTRATGSLTEGSSANIYRTVGTNTLDSGTPAITEHGILSQAATGGGTLWDRSVFSAINLVGANGDGLQTTYDMTASAGG